MRRFRCQSQPIFRRLSLLCRQARSLLMPRRLLRRRIPATAQNMVLSDEGTRRVKTLRGTAGANKATRNPLISFLRRRRRFPAFSSCASCSRRFFHCSASSSLASSLVESDDSSFSIFITYWLSIRWYELAVNQKGTSNHHIIWRFQCPLLHFSTSDRCSKVIILRSFRMLGLEFSPALGVCQYALGTDESVEKTEY